MTSTRQSQEYFAQQPMSLLRIGGLRPTNSTSAYERDESNLLTISFLESSERKMRMLKELLSPEQYQSLSSTLFATITPPHSASYQAAGTLRERFHRGGRDKSFERQLRSSPPFHPEQVDFEDDQQNGRAGVGQRILSKSEANLGPSNEKSQVAELSKSQQNIQNNLAKKRQAVEFFFGGYSAPAPSETLAIELRFGYYLRTNTQAEDKLIDSNSLGGPVGGFGYLCSLVVSLYLALIKLLCNICGDSQEDGSESTLQNLQETNERQARALQARHRNIQRSPYNSRRNMATYIERLRRDGHYEKLLDQPSPVRAKRSKRTSANEKLAKQLIFIKVDSDFSFRLMSDLNRRVLALERARPLASICDLATESKFLIHQPLVARLTRCQNDQFLLNNNKIIDNRCRPLEGGVNFGIVSLKLECLKLVSHKWEIQEERLARKLREEFAGEYMQKLVAPLEKIVRLINDLSSQIGESNADRQPPPQFNLMDRMFSLVEMRAKLLARVSAKQRKLSMIWNELRASRDEQGFNATTLVLDLSGYDEAAHELPLGSLDKKKLTTTLDTLRELSFGQQAIRTSQELALKHLKRWQKFVAAETSSANKHLLLKVRLLPAGLRRTGDQDCPQEELKRRRQLEQWLGSLGLKLILNENYHFDQPHPGKSKEIEITEDEKGQRQVDLANRTGGGPIELSLRQNLRELKLTIVLFERPIYKYLPARLASQLEGRRIHEATFQVPLPGPVHGKPSSYELELELATQTAGSEASENESEPTRLLLNVSVDHKSKSNNSSNSPRLNTKLIDFLYSVVFDGGEKQRRNAFEDTQTKARKLLNRVNPRVLLAIMGKLDKSNLGAKFCLIDPHFRTFESGDPLQLSTGCVLPNVRPVSLRHALLVWRWITLGGANELIENPIYLSDRENLNTLTGVALGSEAAQLLDEFKSRSVRLMSEALKGGQPEGYKSIEQTRALALDYIHQCELLIDQIIGLRTTTTTTTTDEDVEPQQNVQVRPRGRPRTTRDLLLEPQLKWTMARPNLPSVAQVVRALVPHHTARRPLMPNRHRGGQSKLSQLVELSQVGRRLRQRASKDIEGQAVDQWRSFANGRKHSVAGPRQGAPHPLRLVVTIQQATNVPFRLVAPSLQPTAANLAYGFGYPPAMRTSSPLFSPSPLIGATSPPPMSPIQPNMPQHNFLEPTTTYVEAVFQRQQLASSLAQGKNPAWNETLFFDVDLDVAEKESTSGAHQRHHLADEFLHLNLYDCRAYVQNDAFHRFQPQQQQLDVHSLLTQSRMPQQQQMIAPTAAQHQRIEQHLLGSLQVPMSVLLTTSGRIEGSFVLSQPLLLEHAYQFDASDTTLVGARSQPARNTTTLLSLFITLDPPVSLPTSLYLPTGGSSHERVDLFEYARLWERIMLQVPARAANKRRAGQPTTSGRSTISRAAAAGGENMPHIRALVLRDDARYSLACRFLAPLKPPESLMRDSADETGEDKDYLQADQEQQQVVMRRLARFVSLLNPLKHGHFQVRLLASSLWFDSRQLLHDALGGQEEKAVLLCNLFLHLGKCAALLLADCIPDGRCIYVLVWSGADQTSGAAARHTTSQLELQVSELMETLGGGGGGAAKAARGEQQPPVDATDFIARLPILVHSRACQIWDPKTGQRYALTGSAARTRPLPAMSIGSIVTPENVYANLQPSAMPIQFSGGGGASPANQAQQINFDIRQRQLWFPLFSAQAPLVGGDAAAAGAAVAALKRESRRILHVHSWRKQLAQLDQLSKLVGRPVFSITRDESPTLDYSVCTRDQCKELREFIERQVKSNLLIWRPTRPTYFNRTLSRLIAEKLASFERSIMGAEHCKTGELENDQTQDQVEEVDCFNHEDPNWWRAQLAELIRREILDLPQVGVVGNAGGGGTHQVISWPVNLAYSGMRVILDSLYASGVHNADLVLCERQQHQQVGADQSLALDLPNLSTQFLVACHVEPYPARTMSVWLYVGAIVSTMTGARRFG